MKEINLHFMSKSDATMDSNSLDSAYHDSRYTAEISKRMQVGKNISIIYLYWIF